MVSAGSITVAVRVRPPTAWEASRLPEPSYDSSMRGDGALSAPNKFISSQTSLRDIVQIIDDRILTFDPPDHDRARAFMERGIAPPGTKRYKDRRFMFDQVFSHEARQIDVFDATSKPLLDGLMDGYNATIFAYGATGCGKTHTISGTEQDPGIIYLTMAELFQRISERRDEQNIDVVVTFLEIYNEEIRDLLSDSGSSAPRGGLQIREDKTVRVMGLTELRPTTADEVKQIVIMGNTRRTQSPTHANETSSRSHAVLQVHVTQSPRTADTTEERTMATLSIIDLAGSERAAATSNMGQRMVEGANINKSLLALGNCINALCESGGGVRHVPYRNSKLTRLLKFSLGGNCKTVMIVCVAPTSSHYDDTHNTLIYAERATKIRTKVVTRNVVNVDRHVGQYVEAINRLRCEVADLKAKLAGKIGADAEVTKRKAREAQQEVVRQQQSLQQKADDVRQSVKDGGVCEAALSLSRIRLNIYNTRIGQLDLRAEGDLPSDQAAERDLLRALGNQDQDILKADSPFNARLRRASNSSSMFEGLLRAASETRSDRLDTASIEKLQLHVRYQKAEMERVKSEARSSELNRALESQSELVVNLVGMLARCTTLLEDGSRTLASAVEERTGSIEETARSLSASLQKLAGSNNTTFQLLLGHALTNFPTMRSSSLQKFSGHTTVKRSTMQTRHSSVASATTTRISLSASASPKRRTSYGRPQKRTVRSSGLRPSLEAKEEGKKSVRFGTDQVVEIDEMDGPSTSVRNISNVGSESEWEDEKTEETSAFPFLSAPPPPRRSRKSILDPGSNFLRAKASSLSMLAEGDESDSYENRRGSPFSDRANRLPTSSAVESDNKHDGEPSRRASALRAPGSVSKSGRRKSQLGPVRSEKRSRRRTSQMISPSRESGKTFSGGAKRVPASPSKRPTDVGQGRLAVRSSLRNASSSSMTSTPEGASSSSVDLSKSRAWR